MSGAEDGAASEALWLSPDPETADLCIPHPHPCSLPSAESRNQGGSRWSLRQKPLGPGGPLCSHQEGGRLFGAGNGAASDALWLSPVPETAGLCIPHRHPCSLPSAESRSQGGSGRQGLWKKLLGSGGPLCSHQEGGPSCISLSELLKSFLMSSTIIMRYAFKSGSRFSDVLGVPRTG